jgi:hypothetical protein
MKRHHCKMRALRGRYGWSRRRGHSFSGGSAITRPAGSGLVDVVIVDGRGTVKGILARRVSRSEANGIIAGRHS